MYCGNCGAYIGEGNVFCGACGAPAAETRKNASGRSSRKDRWVGIGAVAAAVVLLIVLTASIFGGRSAEWVAKATVEGILEPDLRSVFELIPEEILREQMEMDVMGSDLMDTICESYDEQIRKIYNSYEDMSISYKIVGTEKVDEAALKRFQSTYEAYDLKVRQAVNVEAALTIVYGGDESTTTITIPVVKIGNSWYLDFFQMDSLVRW